MTHSLKDALAKRLEGIPPERTVYVGVGNDIRGDDAAGPAVISLIEGLVPHAVNAGTTPENVTGPVKRLKPQAIIIVDAVHFGDAEPGTARLVEIEEAGGLGITTHKFSLGTIMEYLKHDTGADVFMIGIQPGYIGDRRGVSPKVRAAIKEVADAILFP